MRGSYYLIGAMLGKYGSAKVDRQGGCPIGERPIDQHIKGFESLGAKVIFEGGATIASADHLRRPCLF